MHVLIHDYANYAFSKQLASHLAERGMHVTYAFNVHYDGPNSKADPVSTPGVTMLPVGTAVKGRPSASFFNRLRMELAYATELARQIRNYPVDVILSANTPSLVQSRLITLSKSLNTPVVAWVQDLYGVAAHKLLRKRLPVVGEIIGRYFIELDKRSLRACSKAVLITDDFRPFARQAGVPDDRLHVIENWAPVQDIPRLSKDNAWARSLRLPDLFRFVYSGTLAMKHNPELLVQLAKGLRDYAKQTSTQPAELMVVSSSPGARWLAEQVQQQQLTNVRLMDFQPAASFPSILGSADVLLAVLENDAAAFSVPSKVLSYLCAGKPILAAIPGANLAARIISGAGAGKVVEPTRPDHFAAAGLSMMQADDQVRCDWGDAARDYAERTFDLDRITSRFHCILQGDAFAPVAPVPPRAIEKSVAP